MTLLGFVWDDRFNEYTGFDAIDGLKPSVHGSKNRRRQIDWAAFSITPGKMSRPVCDH
jgi:hypothetical protein